MGITQESEIIPRRARDVVIALRLKSKANEVELRGRGGTTRARSAWREERRRRTQSRSGSEGRLIALKSRSDGGPTSMGLSCQPAIQSIRGAKRRALLFTGWSDPCACWAASGFIVLCNHCYYKGAQGSGLRVVAWRVRGHRPFHRNDY